MPAQTEVERTLAENDGGVAIEPEPVAVATHRDEPAPADHDEFAWLDAPLPPEEPDAAPFAPGSDAPDRVDVALSPVAGGPLDGIPGLAPIPAPPSRLPVDGEGWSLKEARVEAALTAEPRRPFFQRLREGLSRSSNQLGSQITALFTKRRLDETTLQEFEDVLIQADLGVETALRITDRLSDGRFGREISGEAVRAILAEEVEKALAPVALPLELDLSVKPHVMLVVGVNGTGKTTTIGKLAAKLRRGGLSVTLAAGDTFRAAAVEQLKIWGERTGSTVVAKAIGADAAGLAFEAYDEAVRNGSDVLIIDTAGRLQNRAELMDELAKIVRVLQKRVPDAPHTVLQTLDATTGQNALSQVDIFRNVAGVNGLVMTKLDGTARGGILVAIAAKHKLPVFFVGVGEGIDDLEPFKARDFAEAIAGRAGTA
nr:signal recognition particle-docking protein FtsY [Aureimonas jatrophae]